jgi:two-component system LytT family sensor kinase
LKIINFENILQRIRLSVLFPIFWMMVTIVVFTQASLTLWLKNGITEWLWNLVISLGWAFWAVLSPFVINIARKIIYGSLAKRLLIYLGWSFVFTSLHVSFQLVVFNLSINKTNIIKVPDYIAYQIHGQFLIFFFIVLVVKGIDYYKSYNASRLHAEKLNAELSNARLSALKMQLNPHFLFNTHHSISSLMLKNENEKANSMLIKLSDFLRTTLENNNQLSTLADEIKLMKFYLDIQEIRFGDKLVVKIDLQQSVSCAAIPTFILQPIIENAIIHGIAPYSQAATLTVTCRQVGDRLEIEVHDNGAGIGNNMIKEGIGIKNTKSRLAELYDTRAGMEIKQHPVKGTITRIWLPFSEYNPKAYEQN